MKNVAITIFKAVRDLLVWSFAIVFYLLNSVNVRLFFWTNLRFFTLLTSINGAINFIFAGILLII